MDYQADAVTTTMLYEIFYEFESKRLPNKLGNTKGFDTHYEVYFPAYFSVKVQSLGVLIFKNGKFRVKIIQKVS